MSSGFHRICAAARRLKKRLASLQLNSQGNIALITALLIPLIIVAAGGVVDLSGEMQAKSQLQDAADAASLAAANAANNYINTNGSAAAQIALATTLAQTTAQKYISANTQYASLSGPITPTVTTTVSTTTGVTVNISFVGVKKPSFLPLIGINQFNIAISSTTIAPRPAYYQIVFLVDISNSMAIGGTSAAITALEANSQINCAFACHDPNHYDNNGCYTAATTTTKHGQTTTTPAVNNCDYRAIAKTAGIQLKIDYVNTAIQDFLTQLAPYSSAYPGHFSVGIDTYGTNLTVVQAPTTNITTAQTAAQSIDVEAADPASPTNYGYTTTTAALNALLPVTGSASTSPMNLANVGDGSSATSMVTYVIFLSDGVEDLPSSATIWNRNTDLSYVSACTALKNLNPNLRMFSIWAQYNVINPDSTGEYPVLIAPLATGSPSIQSAMQSCASPSNSTQTYYMVASDGPGIQAAVTTTFNVIINGTGLRVSQ